jgi:hypothetical protein
MQIYAIFLFDLTFSGFLLFFCHHDGCLKRHLNADQPAARQGAQKSNPGRNQNQKILNHESTPKI